MEVGKLVRRKRLLWISTLLVGTGLHACPNVSREPGLATPMVLEVQKRYSGSSSRMGEPTRVGWEGDPSGPQGRRGGALGVTQVDRAGGGGSVLHFHPGSSNPSSLVPHPLLLAFSPDDTRDP